MSMPMRFSAAPTLPARHTSRSSALRVQALFKPKATKVKEPEVQVEEPKKKAVSMTPSVLNALDFAAPRSRRDAELLYDAKYGKRGDDGRMTPEQYQALRRKVIGTAKDYWKDWVEEERVETTYYKPDSAGGTVPYLNVLIGIVVAMVGVTILVVAKTA